MELVRTETISRRQVGIVLTFALVLMAAGVAYWASPVLIPLALAVLLAFLLNPIVSYLQKRGVPRSAAAFAVTASAVLLVVSLGWLFTSQVVQLAEQLPSYEKKVTDRIAEIRENGNSSLLNKIQGFAETVGKAASPGGESNAEPRPQRVILAENQSSLSPYLTALTPAMEPIAILGLVVVQLIYLLIDGENLRDRFLLLAGKGNLTVTTRAIDDASSRIGRYLLAQFALNVSFGVLVTVGLWLFGVPHAMLCGFLAGFLRYIPYLGPWLAVTLPVMLSFITSDGWVQPIGVVLVFGIFELISNVVVEPLVYGRSIGVSQSSLIVAIAFWAWLWGPVGLVLAAPLTVCLAIIGKYIPGLKFLDILLSDTPVLTTETRFYQRLLAHDEDGAFQIANADSDKHSLVEMYDQLLIPALIYAKRDAMSDRLGESEAEHLWALTAEIGDEIAIADCEAGKVAAEAATPPQGRVQLLACPSQDGADEASLKLIQTALDPSLIEIKTISKGRLASEVATIADDANAAIVLITALPPGGIARARLLCMRLRQRMPEVKIIIARCAKESNAAENHKRLLATGADFVCQSLEESVNQTVMLARLLRPSDGTQTSSKKAMAVDLPKHDSKVA